MPRRTRYQQGSVQREKRQSGSDVWVFRWWESASDGTSKRRKAIVGTVQHCRLKHRHSKLPKRCALTPTNKPRIRKAGRAQLPNWSLITGSKSWSVRIKDASRSRRALATKAT